MIKYDWQNQGFFSSMKWFICWHAINKGDTQMNPLIFKPILRKQPYYNYYTDFHVFSVDTISYTDTTIHWNGKCQ